MKCYIQDMHKNVFSFVPELAAWTHVEFVKIHPFRCGNGQIARLLLNYQLMLNDYPPINIKKDNVREYFDTLETYALKNDIGPFTKLVQENITKSLDKFIDMYEDYYKEQF